MHASDRQALNPIYRASWFSEIINEFILIDVHITVSKEQLDLRHFTVNSEDILQIVGDQSLAKFLDGKNGTTDRYNSVDGEESWCFGVDGELAAGKKCKSSIFFCIYIIL